MKLGANEAHLWQVQLAGQEGTIHSFRKLLSPDEMQRADQFHFERDRIRFTVARAAMRKILATYVGGTPESLAFSYGAKGKPEFSSHLKHLGIQFNLSHSRDFALLAVAKGHCLGVDIEYIDREFASDEIAARFFSQSEVSTLLTLLPGERTEAFFNCWTRKEAYIKALGEGFSVPLGSFGVAFGPGVPPALLWVKLAPQEVSRWSIYEVAVPQGYAAALVIEGQGHRLRQWRWEPEF
jgi:4'-phosphopantetheinyl transferase